MRRFTLYRREITPGTERFPAQAYNDPGVPQVEGVVFSDGRVACRWLTEFRSTVAWDSFTDFEAIHGHPEYGTEIVWHDAETVEIAEKGTTARIALEREHHDYMSALRTIAANWPDTAGGIARKALEGNK